MMVIITTPAASVYVSYDVMCPRAYVYLAINHDIGVNYYVMSVMRGIVYQI